MENENQGTGNSNEELCKMAPPWCDSPDGYCKREKNHSGRHAFVLDGIVYMWREEIPCEGECRTSAANSCGETAFKYVCTRIKGHDGPHVACGVEHGLLVWRDVENKGIKYVEYKPST